MGQRSTEKGVIIIEAAIITLLFMMLLSGAIDYSRTMQEHTALQTAAQLGARVGAKYGSLEQNLDRTVMYQLVLAAVRRSVEVSGYDPAHYEVAVQGMSVPLPFQQQFVSPGSHGTGLTVTVRNTEGLFIFGSQMGFSSQVTGYAKLEGNVNFSPFCIPTHSPIC